MAKRTVNRPEEALHRAVAEYLERALPKDAFFFHVPNGGARTKAEAGVLKAMGVKAGIPDICIVWNKRVHFIELKPKGGYFTRRQKETLNILMFCGARIWAQPARSLEDVEAALSFFGMTTAKRAKVMA